MSWVNFFDEIFVINLTKRSDRLLDITQHFEDYEIPFIRVSAVEDGNGAKGLMETMKYLFLLAADKGHKNILVFEDDAMFAESKDVVDLTMGEVIKQLPENYLLCYLGGQPSGGYSNFYSPNLLPAIKYFATHAVMYSIQGIKEIMGRQMDFPIDNWYVDEIQTIGRCFAIDPMLCIQRPGFSNIGNAEIDWSVFMIPRHREKLNELNARR